MSIACVASQRLYDVEADALTTRLWQMLEAMAQIGLYVWGTDHLSDRELYDLIVSEVLPAETFLDPDDPYTGETFDMNGNGTEESERIFLTYYADEKDRARWRDEFGSTLPPRQRPPFDRDRLLPTMERRLKTVL